MSFILSSGFGSIGLAALCAYLIGTIPFGVIVTRIFRLGDIRNVGSGNIGATNVLRTGHKLAALATLLLDGGKGIVAIALIAFIISPSPEAAAVGAVWVVLGHCYPIWLGFRGGKGIATGLGVFLMISWPLGVCVCVIWLAIAAVSRKSSLASIGAFITAPIIAGFLLTPDQSFLIIAFSAILLLCLWKHLNNIQRLIKGTEPSIGQ